MAKYQEDFKLEVNDIVLIENILRKQVQPAA